MTLESSDIGDFCPFPTFLFALGFIPAIATGTLTPCRVRDQPPHGIADRAAIADLALGQPAQPNQPAQFLAPELDRVAGLAGLLARAGAAVAID